MAPPARAPETSRVPNCNGTVRLGVVGSWSVTNSPSASTVNTHGVMRLARNPSTVAPIGSHPSAAAQLTAAGAIMALMPATTPISRAARVVIMLRGLCAGLTGMGLVCLGSIRPF